MLRFKYEMNMMKKKNKKKIESEWRKRGKKFNYGLRYPQQILLISLRE